MSQHEEHAEEPRPQTGPDRDAPEPRPHTDAPEPRPRTDAPEPRPRPDAPEPRPRPDAPEPRPRPDVPESRPRPDVPEFRRAADTPAPRPRPDVPEFRQGAQAPRFRLRPDDLPESRPSADAPGPRQRPRLPEARPGAPASVPEFPLRKELPEEVPAAVAGPRGTEPRGTGPGGAPTAGRAGGAGGSGEPAGDGTAEAGPELTGRRRLVQSLWPPRLSRAQLIVAVLLFGLGFGLAVQVASNSDSDSALRGARQEDLVRILDELDGRTQRLEDEKQGLEKQRQELENSSDQAEEARRQTIEKERQLGILAGTVAAQGPGITVTIEDTKGTVRADMLLDAIQELRAAGAEAIQVNGVRVVAGTYLTDSGKSVDVDGNKIEAPYRFKVIGKPQDLEPALNIPGGVVQTLEKEQATVTVERSDKIVVDALRAAKRPDYARSSSQ